MAEVLYSRNVENILIEAEMRALELGETEVDSIHILYAFLTNPREKPWFDRLGIPIEKREYIMSLEAPADYPNDSRCVGFTERAEELLRIARAESSSFGEKIIFSVHLFAGLLQTDPFAINQLLLGDVLTMEELIKASRDEARRLAA